MRVTFRDAAPRPTRSSDSSPLSSQSGFSLVELVLSMMIISIVIVGVAAMFLAAQARGIEAQHEAAANASLQQQLEQKRAATFASLSDGTVTFTPSNLPHVTSATIVTSTVNSSLKQVVASVTWTEGTRGQTSSLSTYIGQYGVNRQ